MFLIKITLIAIALLTVSVFAAKTAAAQQKIILPPENAAGQNVKTSPAYAEILLRKTEAEAEIEALLISYTEEFPKVVEARYEIVALKKEMDRLAATKIADSSRLSLALGKLMVKKAELQTDLWKLLKKFDAAHAEVKRTKKKMEIFEAAIKEILG